jgi:orotidine-5'-phosphate decarboxylase
MACKFFKMLEKRWAAGARVCVGLDSDPAKLPIGYRLTGGYGMVAAFNTDIIIATKKIALAYKPNIAFYSGKYHGEAQAALHETITSIRQSAPGVPIILDAKRADIGNTNVGYVAEAFEAFDADAITVSPYFGMEAMKPFLEQKDKGIIVLCRTSNKGAGEFQDLFVRPPEQEATQWNIWPGLSLHEYVAHRVAHYWNYNGNCALVVGATAPEQLGQIRKIVGDMWILIPGIGTQGGDVEALVCNGLNSRGSGIIINSSSGIIFASGGPDFAHAAYNEADKLTDKINGSLGQLVDKRV